MLTHLPQLWVDKLAYMAMDFYTTFTGGLSPKTVYISPDSPTQTTNTVRPRLDALGVSIYPEEVCVYLELSQSDCIFRGLSILEDQTMTIQDRPLGNTLFIKGQPLRFTFSRDISSFDQFHFRCIFSDLQGKTYSQEIKGSPQGILSLDEPLSFEA